VFAWWRTVTDSVNAAMIFGGITFATAAAIVIPMQFSARSRPGNALPALTPGR
jgi:hypothetical protein